MARLKSNVWMMYPNKQFLILALSALLLAVVVSLTFVGVDQASAHKEYDLGDGRPAGILEGHPCGEEWRNFRWGWFKFNEGKGAWPHSHSSVLHGLPWGCSWENACELTLAPLKHMDTFGSRAPDYCDNTGFQIWGVWQH
jgi:hypothetical protein